MTTQRWSIGCLLGCILLCVGCVDPDPTGIGAHLNNKQAETAFKRLGGQVHVLAKSQERLAVSLRMFNQEVPVEALRVARSFWRVYRIDFERCQLPDIWIQAVPTFKDLRQLALHDMELNDEQFIPIAEGPNFLGIKVLDLTRTQVSDRAVAAISKQSRLSILGLAHTQVSDESLKYIADMEKLERVYLNGSLVTAEGVDWLAAERPDLKIEWQHSRIEDPMQPFPISPTTTADGA